MVKLPWIHFFIGQRPIISKDSKKMSNSMSHVICGKLTMCNNGGWISLCPHLKQGNKWHRAGKEESIWDETSTLVVTGVADFGKELKEDCVDSIYNRTEFMGFRERTEVNASGIRETKAAAHGLRFQSPEGYDQCLLLLSLFPSPFPSSSFSIFFFFFFDLFQFLFL